MEQQTNLIQPAFLSQPDHDLLIELRTTLNGLVDDVKQYNTYNTALELRVRTLENMNNKTLGGGKTLFFIMGGLSGIAGLILATLNYIHR